MATAATSTFELNRDALIRRALQLAGALAAEQEPEAADLDMGADYLNMALLDLQSDGILPTQVTRTTLALVDGTASYALPSDTFDVAVDGNNFVGTVIAASGTTELPVHAMTRSDYEGIPDKETEATPTKVYIERLATVTAVFWPVPSEAMTFRYQQIRVVRDVNTGAVTVDMSKRWQLAVCYELACHLALAKSMPLDRLRELRKAAEYYKDRCKNSDVEKVNLQMSIGRYY